MRDKDRFRLEEATCRVDEREHAVANLSLGGFFVVAESPLPVGQVVALRLTVAGRALDVVAKVAWANAGEDRKQPGLPNGYGVKITRIDLGDKLALVEIVRRASSRPSAGSVPSVVRR